MKDPAFLFYPGDWTLGTMHMTLIEKGAYMDLLMLQFSRGKFTEAHAKHMLNGSFDIVWATVSEKFKTDGTFYWNERLEKEKQKRAKFTESRRNNALNTKKNNEHMNEHMHKHMENENINENVIKEEGYGEKKKVNIPFETFWNLYDKKRGDRVKLEKKWNDLSDDDRQKIMDYIPGYKLSQPDKLFRKDPSTFLNNRSWNDEIIPKKQDNNEQHRQINSRGIKNVNQFWNRPN